MEAVKESRVLFLQQKPLQSESVVEQSPTDSAPMNAAIVQMPVSEITSSPYQTRQFDETTDLSELVASIRSHGVLQPVLVRKREGGEHELVAGERRFRAAQLAGLTAIPAIVSTLSDRDTVEISIIENAQRENLNAIEEAKAISILAKHFSLSQMEIAQAIGKSRVAVSNSLRLLQLDPEVQDFIVSGQLSAGHGKALLMLDNRLLQRRLARRAARRSLSVRGLEELVTKLREKAVSKKKKTPLLRTEQKDEAKIQSLLGIETVSVRSAANGSRHVTLRFEDEKKWKQFMSRLRK